VLDIGGSTNFAPNGASLTIVSEGTGKVVTSVPAGLKAVLDKAGTALAVEVGDVEAVTSTVINVGTTVVVPNTKTLSVASGANVINKGTIIVKGTLSVPTVATSDLTTGGNFGTITVENDGAISETGTVAGSAANNNFFNAVSATLATAISNIGETDVIYRWLANTSVINGSTIYATSFAKSPTSDYKYWVKE
jgi:hypothetical protein